MELVLSAVICSMTCAASVPPVANAQIPVKSSAQPGEEAYQKGLSFADGEGVPQDYRAAAVYYRRAADLGHPSAQYELGWLYENGLGLNQSDTMALEWYRKSAAQGLSLAQTRLASLYARGKGVRKSDSEAAHWYQLAADQDEPEALSQLAAMYQEGRGAARDNYKAFALFRRAAEGGNAFAQLNLGVMYANGDGTEVSYEEAWVWLDIASRELKGAEQIRDRVAKEMSSTELEQARDLSSRRKRSSIAPKR